MSDLERVLSRLATDAGFADAVREHPLQALHGYVLDDDAWSRLEAVLGGSVTLDRLMSAPRSSPEASDRSASSGSSDVSS